MVSGAPRPGGVVRAAPRWAAGAASFVLFALIAWSVSAGRWDGLDALAGEALHAPGSAWPRVVSALHAPRGILAGLGLGIVAFAAGRRRVAAFGLPVLVLGGATLNHVVKHALQRPRPGLAEAVAGATDFAFPSGHVANATLLYGACLALAWPMLRSSRSRGLALAAAVAVVAGVAVARVAVGAHRLSDVAAAPPLALGWLWCCLALVASRRRALPGDPRSA